MDESLSDARHQSYTNIDRLWSAGHPQILPVDGTPWCEVRLDPSAGVATLRTAYQVPEPDVARLKNLSFQAVMVDHREVAEIIVRVDNNVHSAYGLLAIVADELQLRGIPLGPAVATGVERYRDVLASRVGLSDSEEIGLYGELLFLEFLFRTIGAESALESWQGPLMEEHDFVFGDRHLEIKTTASERRLHVINGLWQLVPLVDIPLCLISVQLTRTSADLGVSLPSLIATVRRASGGYSAKLDQKLEHHGWDSRDADLYPTSWLMRAAPRAYLVDDDFPALTPAVLSPVVPNLGLLSDVSYRVDTTDLQHTSLPEPYAGFVDGGKG